MRRPTIFCLCLIGLILPVSSGLMSVRAAPPAEVTGVGFATPSLLTWGMPAGTDHFNLYRADSGMLASGVPPRCLRNRLSGTDTTIDDIPASGEWHGYIVTAESDLEGEGTPGLGEGGLERPLHGRCTAVEARRIMDGLGYGRDDWAMARLETLGPAGFIAEQLDPASIDESTNTAMNDRLVDLTPPEDIFELIGRQVVQAVYGRRQLEQRMAFFWANHFNTYYPKVASPFFGLYPSCDPVPTPQCDPEFPAIVNEIAAGAQERDVEIFRALSFNGTFAEMVYQNATGTAMLLFLDTVGSVAGVPNENFPRELLELFMMGVNGGYTQTDVEELSRAFTGWTICNKPVGADRPNNPCLDPYYSQEPNWVAHFVPDLHDCTAKTLFAGTPHEFTIPDTCANPSQRIQDVTLAIDGIAAHPATARFISKKMIEMLLTEDPTTEQIDSVVAAWNDPTNPHGVGDLREVTRAVLELPEFGNPGRVPDKIKTPFEFITSGMRMLDGDTNGVAVEVSLLLQMQHLPFYNSIPTGWPENGASWIDTNNILQRQNAGITAIAYYPNFFIDGTALVSNAGLTTDPGMEPAIVDMIAARLFAGEWTPAERARAIEYLETDPAGAPAPIDSTRLQEIIAHMLGLPQFQEQ